MTELVGAPTLENDPTSEEICSYLDGVTLIDQRNEAFVQWCLSHRNDDVRGCAARAVGRLHFQTENTVGHLTRMLQDNAVLVRQSAAAALGNIGIGAKSAVPALADALLDEDPDVREFAALALKDMGKHAAAAVDRLAAALNDRNAWVRGAAAWALSRLGGTAALAVPQLLTTLNDSNLWVQCRTAAALEAAGMENAIFSASIDKDRHQCDLFESCSAGSLEHKHPPEECPLRRKSTKPAD